MPLPKPRGRESKAEFIARCMRNPTTQEEYPKAPQRYAVCESLWGDGKRKELRRKS